MALPQPRRVAFAFALAALLPAARLSAQVTGDYRSAATGNWGTTATWERYNGTSWVPAVATPTSADGVITIRSPHIVTVAAGVTIDQTTIDLGGQVTVNGSVTLNVANGSGNDLTVNGTLFDSGIVTLAASATLVVNNSMTILNGGLLNGNGGSAATKPTTTVASGGSFTIDSGGSLSTGGSGPMIFTVALNGAAIIDGTISGVLNFTVAGTLTSSNDISLGSIAVVSITGTMTQTAGTFSAARGNGGTLGSIGSGGTLALTGSSVFSIGTVGTASFQIASGGTLDMGPSAVVSGNGLLQVDSGANLKIGSADGITTGTTTGNVRTGGTDTYNAGANYTYDGTAPQVTGSSLPASIAGLTINNSAGVTLSQAGDTTVTTAVSLQSGVLNAGSNKVIIPLGSSVTATSGWVYATGAGGLQENVALGSNVARTFPVGTSTASNAVSVTFASVTTAGNLIAKATAGDHPNIGSSTLNSSQSANRYWTLTNSGIVFTNYSATFNFSSGDLDSGTNTSALLVGRYSAGWTYPTVGTRTSTSTQATGITVFGDFEVAEGNATQTLVETAADGSGSVVGAQNVTAGSSITAYAISRDANNIFLRNVAATWSLANITGGVVSGDLVASGDTKSATFTGHLVGTAKIQAVAGGFTGQSGVQTVVPGAATKLVITGAGSQTAGASQNLTITAQDASGNTATSYTGSKNLTFSGANSSSSPVTAPTVTNSAGTAVAFGSTTAITFSSGVATVSGSNNGVMTLYKAETATISATDGSISATGSDRLTVAVSAGALNKFALSLASPQTNGAAFTGTNTLTAQDAYGNTVTSFNASTDNVTIAANSPLTGAVSGLSGGNKLTSAGDFSSGVANLTTLGMTYTGNATAGTFTATSADSKTGTSGSVTISAGAASKLAFGTQPSNTAAGQSISPAVTVRILDANDNLTTSTASVTVAIGTNPGGGVLSGTKTRSAVNGVATFNDLSIDKAGTGYTMTAASTGLTGATSNTFDITVSGYWVNNFSGSDTNPGTQSSPFATIGKATSVLGNSGTVFVQVGNSQSGSPYAANNVVTVAMAGTSGQQTLIQGVASGGAFPLVTGTDPAADAGFDVQGNYVTIDGFEIRNTLVGVYSEASNTGARISNNYVVSGHLAYGIILDTTSNAWVHDNRVEQASGGASFFGIWDYTGNGNVIELNKVEDHGVDGIVSHYSTGLTIRRNVLKNNPGGIHVSNAAGPVTLYNNTVDGSAWLGNYAEQSPVIVTSRNNIVVNGGYGWGWDGIGTISSDYDDVYNNTSNYGYTLPVTPGANSISADPNFVQTTDPTAADYYQLSPGSPCINAGTDVGYGTNIGAVP